MSKQPQHGTTSDGMLLTTCTCEIAIVEATPQQVRDGTPMSCGGHWCHGQPPTGTYRRVDRPNRIRTRHEREGAQP